MTYNLSQKPVLTLFIGSPGDVTEERERAKSVVERINKYIAANLSMVVELRGWEDTIPGHRRPQEIINEDVNQCDLFIGLMYKRWGSPSGEYTSGFEEEFTIAQNRIKRGDLKDIWMFFKEIHPDFLEDPTDQLLKVLAFKQKIESEKKLLYKTYSDTEEWENLLYDSLSFHITREYLPVPDNKFSTHSIPQPTFKKAKDLGITRQDEKETLENILGAILVSFEKDKFKTLDDGVKANLYLLASSLLYDKSISSEMLDVHEIQFLYKNRLLINPIAIEKKLILRTIFSDDQDLKCGWYWYTNIKPDIVRILKIFAQTDYSEHLRYQSIVYLRKLGAFEKASEFKFSLKDSDSVILVTLEIYEVYGKKSDVKELKPLLMNNSEDISVKAWVVIFAILLRSNIEDVIEFILNSSPSEKALTKAMLNYQDLFVSLLTVDHAKRLMATGENYMRNTIFEKICSDLPTEDLWLFTNDRSNSTKSAAFLELIKRGNKITFEEVDKKFKSSQGSQALLDYFAAIEKDKIYLEIYKSMSFEELEKDISWESGNSPIRYRAIAEKYYKKFKSTMVEDLRTKFERIKKPFIELRKISLAMEKSVSELDKYSDFTKEKFVNESIGVMTDNMEENDVMLARELLKEDYKHFEDAIKLNLLKIIEKFGNVEDLKYLKELAIHKTLSIRQKATTLITVFDKNNKYGFLEKLITSNIKEEVRLGLKYSLAIKYKIDKSEVKKLLNSKDSDIRLDALSYLTKNSRKETLLKLMDEYISSGNYYYNIVTWFDRLIYSPDILRKYYRKELLGRLQN